jgi:hypothetical protein
VAPDCQAEKQHGDETADRDCGEDDCVFGRRLTCFGLRPAAYGPGRATPSFAAGLSRRCSARGSDRRGREQRARAWYGERSLALPIAPLLASGERTLLGRPQRPQLSNPRRLGLPGRHLWPCPMFPKRTANQTKRDPKWRLPSPFTTSRASTARNSNKSSSGRSIVFRSSATSTARSPPTPQPSSIALPFTPNGLVQLQRCLSSHFSSREDDPEPHGLLPLRVEGDDHIHDCHGSAAADQFGCVQECAASGFRSVTVTPLPPRE